MKALSLYFPTSRLPQATEQYSRCYNMKGQHVKPTFSLGCAHHDSNFNFFSHSYLNRQATEFAIQRFLNFYLKSTVLEWIFHNQEKKFRARTQNSRYRASKSKNFWYGKFQDFWGIFGTFLTIKLHL